MTNESQGKRKSYGNEKQYLNEASRLTGRNVFRSKLASGRPDRKVAMRAANPHASGTEGKGDSEDEHLNVSRQVEGINETDGHSRFLEGKQLQVVSAALLTTALGVTNRVLYKMALVPLKKYPFFLAQLTTFGYVGVYFVALFLRYRAGIVTREMLALPKWRFAYIGLLEAIGLATGMAASAVIPGALIPIVSQVFLIWQLLLSSFILKKSFTPAQITGALLVIAGVITVVTSGGSGATSAFASAGFFWPLVLAVSTIFPALSSILKELTFRDAAADLSGKGVDLFVVNSFGSGFQALFVFLLLPALSWIGYRIPFSQLPAYFSDGAACLLNVNGIVPGCEGSPFIPFIYVIANLAFNISALNLLKVSSAVVASLSITLAVPLTIAAFTFPIPMVGKPQGLSFGFFFGTLTLVSGLLLYNVSGARGKEKQQ